jgi:signal peptidase I
MNDSPWQDRLWSAAWYFLIPASLSVAVVLGAATVCSGQACGQTFDGAPWQYLLAFAVLEVLVLGVRDRLYGSHRLGANRDIRTVRAEAVELKREAERLLAAAKPKPEVRAEVEKAVTDLNEAVDAKDANAAADGVRALNALLDKHLSHVRKGTTREYVEAIGFAVLVALGIRAFVVEAFKIPSPSMYPTLSVGDNIFVNKFIYGPLVPGRASRLFQGRPVERGEVVVFVFPTDPSKDFIKRVVGLPGDRVWVREDGSVEVNGRPLARCEVGPFRGDDGEGVSRIEQVPRRLFLEWHGNYRYLTLQNQADDMTHGDHCVREPCTVPAGQLFVMGDNRDNSYDSRFWGFVPQENVKGRALWIWWSNLPGAGCGLRYERFGQSIMGDPRVPQELSPALRACMRRGPSASPPPSAASPTTPSPAP